MAGIHESMYLCLSSYIIANEKNVYGMTGVYTGVITGPRRSHPFSTPPTDTHINHAWGRLFSLLKACSIYEPWMSVLRIRIRWIRKTLASWIRIQIRKIMRIHGSGSKGQNINQKLQKKIQFYS